MAAAQIPQDSNLPPSEQILDSYQGQKVTAVDIAGRPDLKVSAFLPVIAQKTGQAFDSAKVNASAAALKAAGHFESVRIDVEPAANGVHAYFVIEPAIYYGIFEFPGAERFAYSRLIAHISAISDLNICSFSLAARSSFSCTRCHT